jgi:hypothetical protein
MPLYIEMYFLNYTRIFRLWQLNSDWGIPPAS